MQRKSIRGFLVGTIGLGLSVGLGLSLVAESTLAQDRMDAERLFGQGVHQYFSGQYETVVKDLGTAIDAGSIDPRIYFFRGLSHLQMGENGNAQADIKRGAELEVGQFGKRNYNIGRSLMRIQGENRMLIENARAEAKVRKDEIRISGSGIPRQEIIAAMNKQGIDFGATAGNPSPRPNLPDVSTINDPSAPFADSANTPDVPMEEGTDDSPFAGEQTTPSTDPFGQSAADATATKAPSPADDSFAEPVIPADDPADDPFAEPATPAADPFAEPATPAADPFADSGETAASPPAQSKPIPKNVNGSRVFSKLFGALTSPIQKAAEQGSKVISGIPGIGGPPEGPPQGDPFGDDPFGN